ncbi:MAG: hypothetical protein QM612_01480 [Thermomonas sp.]|uniref:hypothetical protein n=1 Tax=Thermomonas sp. TaxID=1971895 RepID=UPI0039E2DFEB
MSWDPFQRAVLAELGHVLYRGPQPVEAGTGDAHAHAEVDAAMLQRLARVAGVEPDVLLAAFNDRAMLSVRDDARAKRALWPHLRALRRNRQ